MSDCSVFEKKASADWSRLVKGDVKVEVIGGYVYAFADELSVLRLFYQFRAAPADLDVRAGFSENRNSWYFSKKHGF